MQYNAAEVIVMTKKQSLPRKELERTIVQLRDSEGLTWEQIAARLEKMGHISKRFGEPLSWSSIPPIYQKALAGQTNVSQVSDRPHSDASSKLALVEAAANSDLDPKHLKSVILSILKKD